MFVGFYRYSNHVRECRQSYLEQFHPATGPRVSMRQRGIALDYNAARHNRRAGAR